ncbi:hypothetical protein GW17_00013846 [Ensete ventricosum]|nr:hypothetical protein GW17_00013846 [Ensete ventricosum]RZR83559.1 hypothetical protein BHM03_00010218 [Ensete ventricosum]
MSLELYVIVIGLISFILSGERADKTGGVYNVKDYGAAGDGQTDNTKVDFSCHGISIGSLGKNVGEKDVIGVKVRKCNLTSTTNGLRIKTWQSSPTKLTATDFLFEHIIMNNVYNPIIIDQNYCPNTNCLTKVTLIAAAATTTTTTAKYII